MAMSGLRLRSMADVGVVGRARIRQQVKRRAITRLVHFTRSDNLPLILRSGAILSRTELESRDIPHHANDWDRIDGHPNHISCSIGFPNTKLLNTFRGQSGFTEDWVILVLDPSPIWWRGSRFCPYNAAKGSGAYIAAGLSGFTRMFRAPNAAALEADASSPAFPHDIQAEVLVQREIPLGHSVRVVTEDSVQIRREVRRLAGLESSAKALFAACADMYRADRVDQIKASGRDVELIFESFD